MLRKKLTAKKRPDYFLVVIVGILIVLGIIIMAGVSAPLSQERFGSPNFYFFRYLLYGLLPGLVLGLAAFKTPLYLFKKWSVALFLINLFLLALVFFPKIGITMGGASRWLDLGIITLQPSEFLKITFVIYLAAWLAKREQEKEREKSTTLKVFLAVIAVIAFFLILQPDISTLVVIITCGVLMYFSASTPLKHIFLIITLGIIGLAVLIKIAPYRLERFLVFLRPEIDPMGMSFHVKQAIITVGSGGILGMGLGTGIQRLLPHPLNDSIFAIFAEQTGFLGSLIIVILFTFLLYRGYTIAKNSQDIFCRLTAIGISSWIALQAFVNIGAMIGVLPFTGIPLPFISYGGTAMITTLIGVGILLNISQNDQKT